MTEFRKVLMALTAPKYLKDSTRGNYIAQTLYDGCDSDQISTEYAITILKYYLEHGKLTKKYDKIIDDIFEGVPHIKEPSKSKKEKAPKLPSGPTLKGKLSSKLPINMDVLEASVMLKHGPKLKGKLAAPHASLDEKHIKDILTPSSKKELSDRIVHAVHAIMSGQGLKRDDAIEYGKILTHLISHIVDPSEQFDNRDFDESIEIIKKIRDGKQTDGIHRRPRIREAIKKKVVKKIVYDSSSSDSDRDSDLYC